ncbi:hypothetical protein [Polynucleobacter sp. 71A-WALBACH]|nr:hypothetical protein [Polynucleobacter sp. 71A-WALBACH]
MQSKALVELNTSTVAKRAEFLNESLIDIELTKEQCEEFNTI